MLVFSQALFAEQGMLQTVGEAYDLKSDELLYRETHCVSGDRSARQVTYENDEGRMIARKVVDYRSGQTTPSFVQHNLYSREMIEVALGDDGIRMSVRDSDGDQLKKTSTAQPEAGLPVVIDAGFDVFVRNNWEDLVAGEKKRFLFPFADRSSLVELRIRAAQCSYAGDSDQCFKLELSNWFLRIVVAPIELGYDAETRQLARYRGLSNIGDENGDGLVVDIKYNYQDLSCRKAPAGLASRLHWSTARGSICRS